MWSLQLQLLHYLQLPIMKKFKYLGSVLSNDAQMDEDIKARISKASSAYGRLQERVWKPHGIKLSTKIKVYRATVLTTLLYGAETWTCYRRHVKILDSFRMQHLLPFDTHKVPEMPHVEGIQHFHMSTIPRPGLSSIQYGGEDSPCIP